MAPTAAGTATPMAGMRMTEAGRDRAAPADAVPRWLPSLLQLASPVLPTGAFSYSQGLEAYLDRCIRRSEGQQ